MSKDEIWVPDITLLNRYGESISQLKSFEGVKYAPSNASCMGSWLERIGQLLPTFQSKVNCFLGGGGVDLTRFLHERLYGRTVCVCGKMKTFAF